MTHLVTHCVVCPHPREATQGMVCDHCSNRILRQVRELEEYLPTLTVTKTAKGPTDRGRPGFASQSPADDTVIHHTDWRSNWHPLDGLGALATINSWANAIREDRALTPPKHYNLGSEIDCLRRNHQWICAQPFVDEYAANLREVWLSVRAAANDPAPRSLGRCITVHARGACGGAVYERLDVDGVQCSTCHRIYSGTDLVRLRIAQEAS